LSSGEAYAIAYCHHCGLGTRKDVDLAHAIYIDAAERGNAYACYVLGALFEKDSSEAKKWLERGALAGLGGAQHKLGQMYERGRGVQRDLARAFFWYTVATDQGCTESKLTLSRIYFSQLNAPIKGAELLCSIAHAAPRGQDESPPKCVSKMRLRISLASLRSEIDAVDLEELWLYGRVLHAQPRLAGLVAGRDDWIPSSLESLYLQSVGHARRAAVTLLSLHSKRKNPLFLLIGKDVVAVLAQMILSSSRKPSNWHVTWSPMKKVDMTTEEIMLQNL
jgi:hypothetical protein